ncbi:MAG TPA: class I SAM-dependent methyltransferase [Polyangia bacterium]|jgi:ubiquinone/menaquinone biosynthesis C-methylase UbiE
MARKPPDTLAAAALVLARPEKSARIVDVEAGLGALTLLCARHAAEVVAVDASEAIIKALRARVAVAKLGNVEARAADPEALPFVERSFDGGFFLSLLAAPSEAALVELRRVLKPGAPAVVAGSDRDALLESLTVAGFDELIAHRVDKTDAWLALALA